MIDTYLDRNKIMPTSFITFRNRQEWTVSRMIGTINPMPVYGWFTEAEGQAFLELIKPVYGGTIAHVGTYEGLSLSYIFPCCKKNGNTVYAIDLYYHPLLEANLAFWGNKNNTAIMVTMSSLKAVKIFKYKTLDVAFVDGDHHFKPVCRDLLQWSRRLKEGGTLCGHDYNPEGQPEVVQAVDLLLGEENLQFADTFWWVTMTNEVLQRMMSHKNEF
jgi:predicted O-methyltransferase YrrM